MYQNEKTISEKEIYKGRVVHLTCDEVELENGYKTLREVIHHPGGVCIVALDEDGNVEIVSKNFKMKPTQKLAEQPSSEGDTWICWGCGQPTDQDICPVCGKKRTK